MIWRCFEAKLPWSWERMRRVKGISFLGEGHRCHLDEVCGDLTAKVYKFSWFRSIKSFKDSVLLGEAILEIIETSLQQRFNLKLAEASTIKLCK